MTYAYIRCITVCSLMTYAYIRCITVCSLMTYAYIRCIAVCSLMTYAYIRCITVCSLMTYAYIRCITVCSLMTYTRGSRITLSNIGGHWYIISHHNIHGTVADPGGGGPGGPDPPPFGPQCRLFNIGPKVGPPPPWNVDDVTRAMSKGRGVLVNVLTPPPPSGNPVSAPEMDPPLSKILDPHLWNQQMKVCHLNTMRLGYF